MKTLSRRAWVLYLLAIAFIVGACILFYTFYTNADSWAMKKANRHIYSSGTLTTAGAVYDETGAVLAQTVDGKRTYNKDKDIRISTLHILGDSQGYISTGVQTSYKDVLTGYNFVDGIYDLKKYGKGSDITLTINAELNKAAYEALGNNKGTVGVYNYKTGELLCVVSKPSYDIMNKPTESINNDKTGAYDGVYLNRFFSGVYTPGSTFKVITSACAIDNIPDIDSQNFKCTGEYKVDGSSVKCLSKHGTIGFEKALNQSCNSAFAQIAIQLGAENLTNTVNSLGFGQTYKIGNIRLAKSSFDLTNASELDIGWAGIGQYTTRVNPCHMLMIVGAIANGGTSPMPYFIKSITSPTGSVKTTQTSYLQPYFSESTAAKLNDMLRSDVVNYYGDGKFSGLKMCGKTGTAEVSTDENGLDPHAWFIGYSQREDLPLAIVVVVENGGGGSSVAIPVASKTMKKAASIYAEK
jgi:penicillin-binding protein A